MGALEPKTIEWAVTAPVTITASAESGATPDEVFAVLADHERWPEWFPSVQKVTVLGPAEGVGARRRVQIPGASVDEEFIIWEPGLRWSFTGTAAKPGFVRALVEDCQLTALPSGGTSITYSMHLDPAPLARPLVRALAGVIRRGNQRAMEQLARRAAVGPQPKA